MRSSTRVAVLVATLTVASTGCSWMQRASSTPANAVIGVTDRATISADGRYVAYSAPTDLTAPGVMNGIYRWDTQTDQRLLVSVSTAGAAGNDNSSEPSISGDGRYLAFTSDADNLVPADTNNVSDVFVRDVVAGVTERVSTLANGGELADASYSPAISADGRSVAFISDSDDLSPQDNNADSDAYIIDRVTHAATLISIASGVQPDFGVSQVAISGNAQYVAYTTDTDLVAADGNLSDDVYVRKVSGSAALRVSRPKNGSLEGGGGTDPSLSYDGRYVAFTGPEDIDGVNDTHPGTEVFIRDMTLNSVVRASVSPTGAPLSDNSSDPELSSDGRRIAFASSADPTGGTDTNGTTRDVFVRDLDMNRNWLLSTDFLLRQRPTPASAPIISGDGRYAGFNASGQYSFDDTNAVPDVFVRAIDVPTVSSITPATAARGATVTFTVRGAGFLDGAKGIPLSGVYSPVSSTFTSSSQITVTLKIDANAATGAQTFYVQNPGTGAGSTAGGLGACQGCLTIT